MRQGPSNQPENDPPKDPDLQRWFQVLGEPPVAHEPPEARLSMLARIEQQRTRRWGLSWPSAFATPALATGLAAGLLVSLGLNLWWGSHFFGFGRQETEPFAVTQASRFDGTAPLSIYRFQTGLSRSEELQARVAEHLPDTATAPVIGFTPQTQRTAFFRIGRRYAAALAALHSGAVDTAQQLLSALIQGLTHMHAPPQLSQHLDLIQAQVKTQPNQIDLWNVLLAGFEPLYQDAYASTVPSIERSLFNLGAWSENLYLAAATGTAQAVHPGRAIQEVGRALQGLNLPPKVLALWVPIQDLIDKPQLSPSDLTVIRHQVQTLQDYLSE